MFKRFAVSIVLVTLAAPMFGQLHQDIIGVNHVGGKYNFTSDNYLYEGAYAIRYQLGSRVIKLWLTRNPRNDYPFNSSSLPTSADQVQVLQHSYFRDVLAMPYTTVVLMVTGASWPNDGMTVGEEAAEEDLFYRLTKHLMQTYQGTQKKFVLQNWEGDWAMRQNPVTGEMTDNEPSAAAVDGMRKWFRARQAGVTRARNELSAITGVSVKAAAEVNHLYRAKYEPNRITVTNNVLRDGNVAMDLYSYSAWDSGGNAALFTELLTYLDSQTIGTANVYVGEYGAAENEVGAAEHLDRVKRFTDAGIAWGAIYMIYWEVYCNTFRATPPSGRPLNADMAGFWLVRPDGTRSPVWDYYRSRWNGRRRACCS